METDHTTSPFAAGHKDGSSASRVTPSNVRELSANEIFVFGSNSAGRHYGGAALYAVRYFGAVMGIGEGLQGRSYALPTMGGLAATREAVLRFTEFAGAHPQMRFLVTAVGCGIAGYSQHQIAPMFEGCIKLENVALPQEFWEVLKRQ